MKLTRRGRAAAYLLIAAIFAGAFALGASDYCWQPTGGYGRCMP